MKALDKLRENEKGCLNDREAYILRLYFGLNGYIPESLDEIAENGLYAIGHAASESGAWHSSNGNYLETYTENRYSQNRISSIYADKEIILRRKLDLTRKENANTCYC